jgi:serine---pyruvate transaminase
MTATLHAVATDPLLDVQPYDLVAPGPTPIPAEVVEAMTVPLLHHRSSEFKHLFASVLAGLRRVFRTDGDVLVLASTGTGAMESAVVNTCSPGDRVAVVVDGYFSERWAVMAERYGCDVARIEYEWGEEPTAGEVAAALDEAGPVRALFVVHCETSTGVIVDLPALAEVARDRDALVIVDAMSSLATVPLEMDEWGLDVVVSTSAKSLMTPPGLSFAALSERGVLAAERATLPRYYLDWRPAVAMQRREPPETAFSAATSLVVGLAAALRMLEAEDASARHAENVRLGRACRAGIRALDLELFSPDRDGAAVMTAALMPEGVSSTEIAAAMYERSRVMVADGEARLSGRIVRIGHMGCVRLEHVERALEALEDALVDAGAAVPMDVAVDAARAAYDVPAPELSRL